MKHYKITLCVSPTLININIRPVSKIDVAHCCKLGLVLAGTILALAAPAAAKPTKPANSAPPPGDIADKQANLQELRGRIESLRKELAESEGHRSQAADRLRESERLISTLQRQLHTLARQRTELQTTLQDLARQARDLESTLGQQQTQLEKLVYRQYLQGSPDSLHMLLNGDDPNQLARDLHYLAAVGKARAELLEDIRTSLSKKKSLAEDTRARADELAAVETEQKEQHEELARQREQRKTVLAQISDKVTSQRKEIGSLQQDEKRLSQLIDRLSKILAAQAAEAARAAQLAKAAGSRNKTPAPEREGTQDREPRAEPARPRPPEPENHHEPEANSGNFARLKGNLRLPSRGQIAGRFGAPREGGGSWKGLFIRAGSGGEVRAVAGGRVVFAEWMRGFGNLLIVDHGDAYLTIYGNNESLLKQVGEPVKGGEAIATIGNSGGNPESGLYFELRHQGQPIDPMKWASLK